jgi:hypothetical protein
MFVSGVIYRSVFLMRYEYIISYFSFWTYRETGMTSLLTRRLTLVFRSYCTEDADAVR